MDMSKEPKAPKAPVAPEQIMQLDCTAKASGAPCMEEQQLDGNYVHDCGEIVVDDDDLELERLQAERRYNIQCMINENTQVISAPGTSESHATALKALNELHRYMCEDDPSAQEAVENTDVDSDARRCPIAPNNTPLQGSSPCGEYFDSNEGDVEMTEEEAQFGPGGCFHQIHQDAGYYFSIPEFGGSHQQGPHVQGSYGDETPVEPGKGPGDCVVHNRISIMSLLSGSDGVGSTVANGVVTWGGERLETNLADVQRVDQGITNTLAPNANQTPKIPMLDICQNEGRRME